MDVQAANGTGKKEVSLWGLSLICSMPWDEIGSRRMIPDGTCTVLLRKYLERIYGKGDVLVFPYFFGAETLVREKAALSAAAHAYFANGKVPERAAWELPVPKIPEDLAAFAEGEKGHRTLPVNLWLFYAVRGEFQGMENLAFLRENLEAMGLFVPSLSDTRFAEKFRESSPRTQVNPKPVPIASIPAAEAGFYEVLREELQNAQ